MPVSCARYDVWSRMREINKLGPETKSSDAHYEGVFFSPWSICCFKKEPENNRVRWKVV